ncbi:MAG: DDE-type integrase/transposase/recombinase, partial [Chlamydiota bacterium]
MATKNYAVPPHPSAFSGITNLKRLYPKTPLKRIKSKLTALDTYTRHKEAKPVKHYNPYVVRVALQLLQLDLLDVRQLSEDNDGIKYILMIIDTFSRRAWAIPLPNKQTATVSTAFGNFLDDELTSAQRDRVERVLSDRGREFTGKKFQTLLREENIIPSHPNDHAPHIERFNRSIQRILYSYLTEKNTHRYIDRLDDIMATYNNRPHSAHGFTPQRALTRANARRVNYVLEAKLEKRLRPDK